MHQLTSFGLLFVLLTTLSHCETHTGYVDLSSQLAQPQFINDDSNVICFNQVFQRTFPNQPKIAVSLAEFKSQNQGSYHLFIRALDEDISETEVLFSVLARRQISLWNKIVFSYLATDSQDLNAGIKLLDTQKLSTCRQENQQRFQIAFTEQKKIPEIAAYIAGFDVTFPDSEVMNFQISIGIISKKQNSFILNVSKKTMIDIYAISIGYVVIQKGEGKNNQIQVSSISEQLSDIPAQSPYIFIKPHKFVLKHANMFMGFQSFNFQYQQGEKDIKSLALTINSEYLVIGCLDSSILKNVKVSYVIIKQIFQCQSDQIIYYDESLKSLSCSKCSSDNNMVPNTDKDVCICKENYYKINQQCFKKPQRAEYNPNEGSFICEDEFTMIFNQIQNQYLCQKAPKHKLYNSQTGQWQCLDSFEEINEQCLKIPKNGYYDIEENKIKCKNQNVLIQGQCVQIGQNEQFSFKQRKFVCKQGYFRVNDVCVKPIKNAYYDQEQKKFVCHAKYYFSKNNQCQEIPPLMKFNQKLSKLACEDSYYYIKNVGCQQLPQGMRYIESEQRFDCKIGAYFQQGACRVPQNNQEWSKQLNKFICKKGTYKIQASCLSPPQNSHYSQITQKFECNANHYNIDGVCLAAPQKMEYSPLKKMFICSQGYYSIGELQCRKIPQNRMWSQSLSKLICENGYYQMKDSSCKKPAMNQIYLKQSYQFVCDTQRGYFNIRGNCNKLPQNSKYLSKQSDFKCIPKYFENEGKCQICGLNCVQCQQKNQCLSCRQGFEVSNGACIDKCGDGIKFVSECDDGNTENGDGCSEQCKIQIGFMCQGGSPKSKDKCTEDLMLIESQSVNIPQGPLDLRMVGMSHLYGKIILNVKISYVPIALLSNTLQLQKIFRVLTNSKIPLKVSSMYIDTSEYTFVVLYDFNKFEPIPEFLTRVQIAPEIKTKYYDQIKVNPLFIRINPALMAKRSSGDHDIL